jgi:hypothetical protein
MGDEATEAIGNQARRKRVLTGAVAAVVILILAAVATAIAVRWHQREAFAGQRPSGIPASVPTGTINLMGLSPVPASAAPGFTLTDQDGRNLPLSRFRGKVVVLEFMDPHCTISARWSPRNSSTPTVTLAATRATLFSSP